jgi:hypothetical protein
MASVLAATTTKLLKFQPIGGGLLVLGRCVVAALAVSALEHNVIARHNPSSFPIANCRFYYSSLNAHPIGNLVIRQLH